MLSAEPCNGVGGQYGGQERNTVFARLLISIAGSHSLYKKCAIEKMLFVSPSMRTQYPRLCGSMCLGLAVGPECSMFLFVTLMFASKSNSPCKCIPGKRKHPHSLRLLSG